MPSCPRGDVVAKGEVAVYHAWNRCVQRAFLAGQDPVTGHDYEYRRDWIQQTEQLLAGLFALDVGFHAELSNHIHLVVRTRPDVAQSWSDEDVARRWLIVAKLKRNGNDTVVQPTDAELAAELNNPGRVDLLRRRLASISWFMGTLCENISRRCNLETGNSGAFWEHRFECRSLADETAITICGMYVDLNQIRAGEALTPETSTHTSAYERILGLQQRRSAGADQETLADSASPDGWLCELTLQDGPGAELVAPRRDNPRRASDKGLLPVSLEKYLELLDWTGRQVREGKRGAIPASLAPILDRLGIQAAKWVDAVESFHSKCGLVVGSAAAVAAAASRAGRHWFRGGNFCAAAASA
jgi:hypothetical protein